MMSYQTLLDELKINGCVFSIKRLKELPTAEIETKFSCVNKIFSHVATHGPLILTGKNITCPGARIGCGFCDGLPNIPGGFGNFIAQGAGPGYPEGEHIKCSPDAAEQMLSLQPQAVMEGYTAIRVASYCENEPADLVTMLLNPDQFAAALHLFYFRKSSHDEVIVPIASGCAQIFRIPFGELRKSAPKAVMGNLDFVSRPFLPKEIFCLTMSGTDFAQMCADSADSFLFTSGWKPVKNRL